MSIQLCTFKYRLSIVLFVALAAVLAACSQTAATVAPPSTQVAPATTEGSTAVMSDEERIEQLLAEMTLDEKVGQMTQALSSQVSPEDVSAYFIGSVLSGGSDNPYPNTPESWADLYDGYQQAALSTRLGIPIIYGIDSVHGFSHTEGTTIFPHNIGLGATRNPELVKEIGRVTALEMAGTGIRWTFSPTLCVGRNERWGRTYECFGEDPALVSDMAVIIDGYQGDDLSLPTSTLATAKHYVGDGGTTDGVDQGNTEVDEDTLRTIHLAPYVSALEHGAETVMVSYSSWNGEQMHGQKALITDVLKGEMGFKGLVISDYQGINQLPGSFNENVRNSINAGIDMAMTAGDHAEFIRALRSEVEAGRVPMERIDDAVRRILRVKLLTGVFDQPMAQREYLESIGTEENRELGRQAVRESLVLLKNEGNILPLARDSGKIMVTGKSADNIGNQAGGWSITWQGRSGKITTGTTIWQGIQESVAGGGASVTYDKTAKDIDATFDVAIAVIGEEPYAEGNGDRPGKIRLDRSDIALLARLKESGVPTVVVLVSGRPMIITDQLPDWAAFIAAWLPGTEGAGVADVLFGAYAPTGKLPVTWPASEEQIPINVGDETYEPLFPYDFGLTYEK